MLLLLLFRALILTAESKYLDAYQIMAPLIKEYPTNQTVLNNFAVLSLYINKIQDAVSTLEELIRQDPKK